MLDIKNLCFSYDDTIVFSKFSYNIELGTMGILGGASGAGKSTLALLIAGFLKPSTGRIMWNDIDLVSLDPGQRPLSLMFQSDNLFEHLDCWTNVALGLSPVAKPDTRAKTIIHSALSRLNVAGFETRLPSQLSGGQQQRVGLARALARAEYFGHRLLLLDEPLNALDIDNRQDSMAAVVELMAVSDMAVLLISHNQDDWHFFENAGVNINITTLGEVP